jgi:hypothetical protein
VIPNKILAKIFKSIFSIIPEEKPFVLRIQGKFLRIHGPGYGYTAWTGADGGTGQPGLMRLPSGKSSTPFSS